MIDPLAYIFRAFGKGDFEYGLLALGQGRIYDFDVTIYWALH